MVAATWLKAISLEPTYRVLRGSNPAGVGMFVAGGSNAGSNNTIGGTTPGARNIISGQRCRRQCARHQI